MTDIKKLLSKKGWTGKELGQIALANVAHKYKQQTEGIADPTPLVTHGEFSKMLNTLKEPTQINTYNGYVKINEWLNNVYNITVGQEQQAQSNFKTLYQRILVVDAIEQTYKYIEELPLIMTEKQYKDFIEARKAEILEGMSFNLFNALIEATESLVNQLQTNPRKSNPLAGLKEKLEHEAVTDPRILSRYNEVMHRGYYTIDETGQRSDSMTPEEWAKALETEYSLEAEEATKTGDIPARVLERLTAVAKATFEGKNEEEIKAIEGEYNLLKKCTFHLYEEPPEDLNKWEILQAGDLFSYYPSLEAKSLEGEELETDEAYTQATIEDINAFKSEYPTVFEAVLEDMRGYMGDAVDTPIEEWANTMFSWADMHRVGFYDFDKTYLDDVAIFDGNKRAITNGIAILQPSNLDYPHKGFSFRIDENGYYNPPNILHGLASLSIESLFPEDPDYTYNTEEIEQARKLLLDSYYFMLGFNKAIELIIEYFEIPQLEVFAFDTALMARRMDAFNSITAYTYKQIKDIDYEDKDLQAKKLEALKDYFYPLEYEELEIPEENINRVIELFKGFKAFEDQNITSLLCIRPNAYDGII